MPKIAWVMDQPSYLGGAELECLYLLRVRPPWAKDIVMVYDELSLPSDADLYVVQNCTSFTSGLAYHLQGKRVIKRVHDVWPYGDPELREFLLNESALVLMSSPGHREALPYPMTATEHIIPSAIDANKYIRAAKDSPIGQRHGTVWLGRLFLGKGLDRAGQWANTNDSEVHVYGSGPLKDRIGGRLLYRGEVHPDRVCMVLPQYQRFLFLPDQPEPFGRTTAEAWLAGCDLVVNKNVGALWWIDHNPAAIKHGAWMFWQEVKNVIRV